MRRLLLLTLLALAPLPASRRTTRPTSSSSASRAGRLSARGGAEARRREEVGRGRRPGPERDRVVAQRPRVGRQGSHRRRAAGGPDDPRPERPRVPRLYRKRVEAQAQRLLEAGDSASDQRLVEELFCSTQAVTALDRLGDRAFLAGRLDEAEAWWAMVAPLEPADLVDTLTHPDPPAATVARVGAKQLLARLHRGEPGRQALLDAYRKRQPDAAGTLAGKTGKYADTLAECAKGLAGEGGRSGLAHLRRRPVARGGRGGAGRPARPPGPALPRRADVALRPGRAQADAHHLRPRRGAGRRRGGAAAGVLPRRRRHDGPRRQRAIRHGVRPADGQGERMVRRGGERRRHQAAPGAARRGGPPLHADRRRGLRLRPDGDADGPRHPPRPQGPPACVRCAGPTRARASSCRCR